MPIKKIENFEDFEREVGGNKGDILVKFEAEWCMPCKAMAPLIEDVASKNPEIKVLTVDIESEGVDELLLEYGVRSVPTFVRLEKGIIVNSAAGTLTRTELTTLIKGTS